MKILIDMNLSPDWEEFLHNSGYEAVHWSNVGDPRATDQTIMAWALASDHIVFTHDLDFGTILAVTNASGPSVIQVRTQNVLPSDLGTLVVGALKQFADLIQAGALIVIDESRQRARVLPLKPS
jgi:predicted nuclease of predicted toxin-antitoxin system